MKRKIVSILILLFGLDVFAICVKVKEANLRSGPGTNFEKSWRAGKYTPLKRTSKKGSWSKVKDVDGDSYWVYTPLITSKINCGIVKVAEANVRKGPGTNHQKAKNVPLLRYTSFKVLEQVKDWAHVENIYGEKFWIFRKLIWVQ